VYIAIWWVCKFSTFSCAWYSVIEQGCIDVFVVGVNDETGVV